MCICHRINRNSTFSTRLWLGLISRKLLGNAKQVVGVDISQGMVDEYNRRASLMGASTDQIQAVCYDLKGQDGELNDKRFDVIIVRSIFTVHYTLSELLLQCTAAYHHFPSVQETTQKLAFFLKPGGVLLVSDFVKSDNGNMLLEHAKDKVPHKGFEESEVRELFENANLVQFNFRRGIKLNLFNADIEGFIAKGTKIADEGK